MKIELEDLQQDLLWLVVEDATGQIVDCGPYHQDLYATGEMSVELESIKVGSCPFYYMNPQEKAERRGRFFRYRIVGIVACEGA